MSSVWLPMRRIVEASIQALKHDSNYRLDPKLDLRALLQVALYRSIPILRGFWVRLWLGQRDSVDWGQCPRQISATLVGGS